MPQLQGPVIVKKSVLNTFGKEDQKVKENNIIILD